MIGNYLSTLLQEVPHQNALDFIDLSIKVAKFILQSREIKASFCLYLYLHCLCVIINSF